jgi:hypothetical protein
MLVLSLIEGSIREKQAVGIGCIDKMKEKNVTNLKEALECR